MTAPVKRGSLPLVFGRFSLYFAPSIFSAALSVVMLPIATRVVGPMEYGVFALTNAYTGFGSAIATMGGSYVIAHRFLGGSHEERRDVVSTILFLGLGAVTFLGLLLLGLWPFLPSTGYVSGGKLFLAVAAMVAGQPWIVAGDVLTLRGDARTYAVTAVAQSIVSAAVLLIGLFYFGLGLTAFFLSQFAAALVSVAGAFVILREYLTPKLDRAVLAELRHIGIINGFGNIAEALQTAVERTVLSLNAGVTQLGIYSNSQAYRGFASMPVKAVARSIWPVTLDDATDPASDFERTKEAWDLAYLGLVCSGIFFATFGDRLIGGLTHGKFTAAYLVATYWMIYLIVQNLGKPQVGILYALGGGRTYAKLVIASVVVGILAMVGLVPLFGIWGAAAAATLQQAFLRIAIQRAAKVYRDAPFQDGWAYFGILYIVAVFLVRHFFGGPLETNLLIMALAYVLLFFISRRSLMAPMHRMRLETN